jgi:hypothetical protein
MLVDWLFLLVEEVRMGDMSMACSDPSGNNVVLCGMCWREIEIYIIHNLLLIVCMYIAY